MRTTWAVWGQLIRQRRLVLNLSLRELSELAGCAESTLSRIENGRRGVSDPLKPRLARALGVVPNDLFIYFDEEVA